MGVKERIETFLFGGLESGTTVATAELLDSPQSLEKTPKKAKQPLIKPISPITQLERMMDSHPGGGARY